MASLAHDDRSPSLSVREGESDKVLVHCHAGCAQVAVLAALRDKGLWPSEEAAVSPGYRDPRPRRRIERKGVMPSKPALAIWRASKPAPGTLVETYLRSRGITLEVPPSIRFHASLVYGPMGAQFPAMVAAIQAPDRTITAVHRTYLLPDAPGKALVSSPKMMLGRVAVGAVRLAAAGIELAICEGIETGLSFQEATSLPTWCALSTSGLRNVVLPALPFASTVYIAADLDDSGEAAARAAAERFVSEGRKVKVARPIAGKDFNDALRSTGAT
jgi:hypothetical protein